MYMQKPYTCIHFILQDHIRVGSWVGIWVVTWAIVVVDNVVGERGAVMQCHFYQDFPRFGET